LKILLAVIVVALATVLIFGIGKFSSKLKIRVSSHEFINATARYQLALMLIAVLVLVIVFLQNQDNFRLLFSLGNISAPVKAVTWLGIMVNNTWLYAGFYLSLLFSAGTFIFVYFQFRKLKAHLNQLQPFILWLILFSSSNSFSEEVIYRLGIVSPLFDVMDTGKLILLSAALFGIVHYSGMPYGLIGMLMAGFLGWFLAKSVVETHGLFWAWTIHFLQDIIIFGGIILSQISPSHHTISSD